MYVLTIQILQAQMTLEDPSTSRIGVRERGERERPALSKAITLVLESARAASITVLL